MVVDQWGDRQQPLPTLSGKIHARIDSSIEEYMAQKVVVIVSVLYPDASATCAVRGPYLFGDVHQLRIEEGLI